MLILSKRLFLFAVAVVGILMLIVKLSNNHNQKTDYELKMEKRNKIGQLKMQISEMEDSMKLKSMEKEKLLQEFNGVGETEEGK